MCFPALNYIAARISSRRWSTAPVLKAYQTFLYVSSNLYGTAVSGEETQVGCKYSKCFPFNSQNCWLWLRSWALCIWRQERPFSQFLSWDHGVSGDTFASFFSFENKRKQTPEVIVVLETFSSPEKPSWMNMGLSGISSGLPTGKAELYHGCWGWLYLSIHLSFIHRAVHQKRFKALLGLGPSLV